MPGTTYKELHKESEQYNLWLYDEETVKKKGDGGWTQTI